MNTKLSVQEIEKLSTAAAMALPGMKEEAPKPKMSRREKLMRWAAIVRNWPHPVAIFHDLEHRPTSDYYLMSNPTSAFSLAFRDDALREDGLMGFSVGASMDYFKLDRGDLHEFSCDCGGQITNNEMARRIEAIADFSR